MKLEILDKIAALVTVAFGLVAALAWNGAIRAIFQHFTIIAVLVAIWIARAVKGAKGES